ncbi:hypothetical protein C0J52_20903, partial [Blattella germanica]
EGLCWVCTEKPVKDEGLCWVCTEKPVKGEGLCWVCTEKPVKGEGLCWVCTEKPALNCHYGLFFTSNSVTSKSMERSSSTSRGGYPGTWASQDYILVCVDAFSGIVWLFSLREATSAKPQ